MKIIKEKLDEEIFIDILMEEQELMEILQGEMLSITFLLDKELVNLGIRKPIIGEYYAIEEGEIKRKYQ